MKRKKPLKRSPLKRKTPLRPVSEKRRKLMRETTPARRRYVATVFTCQLCNKRQAEDCHEITRGPYREESLRWRAVWLAVCRPCHDQLDDASVWPIERQLAVKLLNDAKYFDLDRVNAIRSDREQIELEQVATWLVLKPKKRN